MSEPRQPRLFISYSRVDRHTTEQLEKHLRRSFDNVWFDESLHGGDIWWNEILRQIAACDIFLYLLSRDSVESEYCRAEFEEAKRLRKQILPILLRARTPIPEDLQHIQFVDISRGFTPESINDLQGALIRIERRISRTPLTPLSEESPPVPDVADDHPTPAPLPVERPSDGRRIPFTIGLAGGLIVIAVIAALFLSKSGFGGQNTAVPTTAVVQPTSTRIPVPTNPPIILSPPHTPFSTAIASTTVNPDVTSTNGPISTLSSGVSNKIAFTSVRDGNPEIYVMNADGTNPLRLTKDDTEDGYPSWSPDGKRIVFASRRDQNFEIYAMNADGSNPVNLSMSGEDDLKPSWSPDGKYIAFKSNRNGNFEIYVMNADGSNPIKLTDNKADDLDPTWSPDGKHIAFASKRDGNFEIYVMNADGSDPMKLTDNKVDDLDPTWSPDGKHIAFTTYRDGYWQIYVMDANGSNPINLSINGGQGYNPAWSPDGKQIAFDSGRSGNYEIYVMDADGKNLRRLTNNPASDLSPAWVP